jgi:intracellular sulfur oxidation DsrE/DsrF family protein
MTMSSRSRLPSIRLVAMLLSAMLFSSAAPVQSAESAKAASEKPMGNAAALTGVEEAKTVFLVKLDSAPRTAGFLKAIRGTHKGLVEQGVDSKVVVVFLGPVVQFLSTEPDAEIAKENGESLQSIAETAAELKALGVQMEVCGAATEHFGVANETVLGEMSVVGNGFISLIGWQSQGYVPMTF